MRVDVEDRGPVRVLGLSNPSKRNALTRHMLTALQSSLPHLPDALGTDDPARVIVLCGDPAGGAFSSGFDITQIHEEERAQGLNPIDGPAQALEACPLPVIAAMEGPVFGGAFELAMACDLRIAHRDARFCMPPARLGLVYAAEGMQRFLRATSVSTCKRIFLGAEILGADEALQLGLIDRVVDDNLFDAAMSWAEQIAANAPLAVQGMLEGLRLMAAPGAKWKETSARIEALRRRSVDSNDIQEGVAAFVEKRAPKFQGH